VVYVGSYDDNLYAFGLSGERPSLPDLHKP